MTRVHGNTIRFGLPTCRMDDSRMRAFITSIVRKAPAFLSRLTLLPVHEESRGAQHVASTRALDVANRVK